MRYLLICLLLLTNIAYGNITLTNSTINFPKQTAPMYQAGTASYNLYTNIHLNHIQLYIESNMDRASSVRVSIKSNTSKAWYTTLKSGPVNQTIDIPVLNSNWYTGPTSPDRITFYKTIREISNISVHIVRHGSPNQQTFNIKQLTVYGTLNAPPDVDSDGDGMIDDHEYIAGTDPYDPNSYLWVGISKVNTNIVIRWTSVENRIYDLMRTENLKNQFYLLQGNIPATPPMNYFYDPISTNKQFYRVQVK